MALLTRDEILATEGRSWEDVPVPEWRTPQNADPKVRVWSMDGDTHEAMQLHFQGRKTGLKGFMIHLCAKSIGDEAGALLFTDDDIAALGKKSGAALKRVYDTATKLNALNKSDQETLAGN